MFSKKKELSGLVAFLFSVFSLSGSTTLANESISVGQTVKLSVSADGSAPFSYQWYKNGATIRGATSSSYTISSMDALDAGDYKAKVSNSAGSTVSDETTLVVVSLIKFTAHPQSKTAAVGSSVTFTAAASGASYQWRKNGKNISGATGSSYTLSEITTANAGTYTVVATNLLGSGTSNSAVLTVTAAPVPTHAPAFTTQPASKTVTAGDSVTFTAAASGAPKPTYQWGKNGTSIPGATGASYTISNVSTGSAGTYTVVATNSKGKKMSNGAVLTVTAAPIPTHAPAFTTQPASKTIIAGDSVTFTAAASGAPKPTYQWGKNGTSIPGATGASYTISNVSTGSAGTYTVVATNSKGTKMSNGAVLTVTAAPIPTHAPAFTTQPASKTVTAGDSVTFTAAASGVPKPTYQWGKNGTSIPGATGASYTISSVSTDSAGTYTVVASNSAGTKSSNRAVLTVTAAPIPTHAPAFTTQPASKTVAAGDSVTFTATASGAPKPTYQWRKNGTSISGATSASYTISSVSTGSAGTYTVVATNSKGTKTSNGAVLTVTAATSAPSFTTQPASKTVTVGNAVTFTAAASGSPKPTYQWRKNGANITGATGTSYTIPSVGSSSAGTYTVVATNSAGTKTSAGAVLTVTADSTGTELETDFNGDGHTDLVWQNISTGQCVVWLMSGTKIASKVTVGTFSKDWNLCGTGDFNGDGKSDLLWQNTITGERSIWLMSGTKVGSKVSLGKVDTDWEICGSGDFNSNGYVDILWQNRATGERSIWLMSGTQVSSKVSLGKVDIAWEICGTGDFNNDGKSDIVWQNILTGERSIWLMSGTKISSKVSLGSIATEWEICGAGDFDGDGNADVVWQSTTTGECFVWLMMGTKLGGMASVATQSPAWIGGN